MAAGDQVRGLARTINGLLGTTPTDQFSLRWRSLAPGAGDPWVLLGGGGRANAGLSLFVPTFGAQQILIGFSYLNTPGAPDIIFFVNWCDDDGGQPNGSEWPDSSLFPIAVVGGIQRFNLNRNEYGPIPTSSDRSLLLPVCAHGFRIGVFSDAATIAGMQAFAVIERQWSGNAPTPTVI